MKRAIKISGAKLTRGLNVYCAWSNTNQESVTHYSDVRTHVKADVYKNRLISSIVLKVAERQSKHSTLKNARN